MMTDCKYLIYLFYTQPDYRLRIVKGRESEVNDLTSKSKKNYE